MPPGLVVGITGATGHIGGVLLRALLASEVAEVRSVARRALAPELGPGDGPRLLHVQADVRSERARQSLQGADLVFHLAAAVWQRPGRAGLADMRDINVEGTRNVLASRPPAVVFASSASVYGAWPDNPVPMDERWSPRPNPQCPYASQKLAGEYLAMRSQSRSPVRCAIARLAAVLGPHADSRVLAGVRAMRLGVPAVRGRRQALQWAHEQDAVNALMRLGQALVGDAPGVSGEVFNVSTTDWLDEVDVGRLAGGRVLALPRRLIMGAAQIGYRCRLSPFGADRAVFLDGPLAVSSAKFLQRLGWSARWTSQEVLGAAMAGEWAGRASRNRVTTS
ncbi:MAG TPA: NAD-dependent epimerase/dehydratase family protein [Acidimicrobiales bacterium]|nr:NAD-dependent epimerase/dehydratase family protein [Acidimicrobiales bacterium]